MKQRSVTSRNRIGLLADRVGLWFQINQRGSTWRTEIIAGLTTFATMSYVLAVNPMILSETGMDRAELITATALAAGVFSILMGILANLPLAQAPGMGANAFFTYTIVISIGVPWEAALGLVFWSGVIFLILTLIGLRQILLDAFPESVKAGMTAGIGLFIAFIGIKNAGLVVPADGTPMIQLGDISAPEALFAIAGLIITIALMIRRVPGAILIVLSSLTFIGLFITSADGSRVTPMPSAILAAPIWLNQLWLALDPIHLFNHFSMLFPALLTLVFLDLFSSLVAMNAMCQRAGLVNAQGDMKDPKTALTADALATIGASGLGCSTANVYGESAAGIESGGRTGITAIIVGLLFFTSLLLNPIFLIIPAAATSPALILIGLLMCSEIRKVKFDNLSHAGPAIITLFLMPLTSISDGMAIGLITWVGIMTLSGRVREVPLLSWLLVASFIAYYTFAMY